MFNLTSWQFNSKLLLICAPLCHNFEIRPKGSRVYCDIELVYPLEKKIEWFFNFSTTEKGHIVILFVSMINLNKHGVNHIENDNR